MTLFVFILLTMFGLMSCRTTQDLPADTEINRLNLEEYFNRGDNVSVITIDGNSYQFDIESFEETYLMGSKNLDLIKVPYSQIKDISYRNLTSEEHIRAIMFALGIVAIIASIVILTAWDF